MVGVTGSVDESTGSFWVKFFHRGASSFSLFPGIILTTLTDFRHLKLSSHDQKIRQQLYLRARIYECPKCLAHICKVYKRCSPWSFAALYFLLWKDMHKFQVLVCSTVKRCWQINAAGEAMSALTSDEVWPCNASKQYPPPPSLPSNTELWDAFQKNSAIGKTKAGDMEG